MALRMTDKIVRQLCVNFTEEQRTWALEHFGTATWPEEFLRNMVRTAADPVPPSTEVWWQTMHTVLAQINRWLADA